MSEALRIGTRGSPLALAQAELVMGALRRSDASVSLQVVPIRTAGDRTHRSDVALDFTDEIDRRLEATEIDLAVHSAKDLPAVSRRAIEVAAYLHRGDPRDCLVLRGGGKLRSLPPGARIGSSSARRKAQLCAARPDLEIVPIRGNIGTRLEKMTSLPLDGVMVAAAGLIRLGWSARISEYLSVRRWLPAPCQGAIAVAVRTADQRVGEVVGNLDHLPTRQAVESERAVVATLGGGCNLPLGALARIEHDRLRLRAALYAPDGRRQVTAERGGNPKAAVQLGQRLGVELAARGREGGFTW